MPNPDRLRMLALQEALRQGPPPVFAPERSDPVDYSALAAGSDAPDPREGLVIRTIRGVQPGMIRFEGGRPVQYNAPTEEGTQNRLRTLAIQEQARAASRQAEAQYLEAQGQLQHEQTAREMGGLSPVEYQADAGPILATGGINRNTLIPGQSQDIQAEEAARIRDRIRNQGVQVTDILGDLSSRGYLDQPGSASLLSFLRSQRGPDVQSLAAAAQESAGRDYPPNPFEYWALGHRYGSQTPLAPASAYGELYSGPLLGLGGGPKNWGALATHRSELLRRAFPDLFPQTR